MALLGLGTLRAAEAKYASIVIDTATGEVLQETAADTKNFPASLTKMMTLYLLFEALEKGDVTLNQKLAVSAYAAKQQPSKLGVKAGSTITVEDAIRALVTKSANDVAVVVAEALGKTESGFAKKMSAKAKGLGMSRSVFYNASGLPDKRQVSTARDMATLSLALMEDFPQYYYYFSLRSFTYKGRVYANHNKLLTRYTGVDGIKTGYTKASGYNIAVSAVRDGRRVIVVVFGGNTSGQRNTKATALLNDAFATTTTSKKKAPLTQEVKADPSPPPDKPLGEIDSAALAAVVADMNDDALDDEDQLTPTAGSEIIAEEVEVASTEPVALPQTKQETKTKAVAEVPLAKQTQVASLGDTATDAPPSGWSIQIGAYKQADDAQEAAAKIAKKVPDPLADARVYVMQIEHTSGTLYRARIVDLSEKDARKACKTLSKKKIDCLVVAPGN